MKHRHEIYSASLDRTNGLLSEVDAQYRPAVLANGFGPESMVLTDIIAGRGLNIEIISLDTGRLPEETHKLAHSVFIRYGPVLRMIAPDPDELEEWTAVHGANAFYENVEFREDCCRIRKINPLKRVLRGKKAWLTGLRREQAQTRANMGECEWDAENGLHKFNPMIHWTGEQVWAYIHDHTVPYNALHDAGYPSIGCAPCTRAVGVGEDSRSGRWWWERDAIKECGLHVEQVTGRLQRVKGETKVKAVEPEVKSAPEHGAKPLTASPDIASTGKKNSAADSKHAMGRHRIGNWRSAMKVLILGGDGFCGWPTALYLSDQGHDVAIVDNLSRRAIDLELECDSLTPIRSMGDRLRAWKEVSGKDIAFHNFNVAKNYQRMLDLIKEWRPNAIVHFAEQRAAPYSMKSSYHKRYTVENNLGATNNVLAAVVESGQDIHIAHLGTMGVYGYGTAGMKIPEGYLKVKVEIENGELRGKRDSVSRQSRQHLPYDQDAGSAAFPVL